MKVHRNSARRDEQGYVLITLILMVALLTIGLTLMAPELMRQLKRDREQELIHRGVQYSRAIKHFVKKNGRYPNTIDELETSGTIHFLRRRYKDPVTGKDFKILHMGDVQMSFGPGLQGATSVANMAQGGNGQGGGFGQSIFASNGFGNSGGLGGNSPGGFGNSGSSFGGGNSFGGGSNGGGNTFGGNNNGNGFGGGNNSFFGGQSNQTTNQPGSNNGNQTLGSDNSQTNSGQPGQAVQNPPGVTSQENGNPSTQVFGGGPIVGVASTSKDKTIRIFSKKDKYYEWQFIYDPSSDTGGLLTTPNQQGLTGGGGGLGTPVANGTTQPGQPGQQNGGFGFGGNSGSPFSPQNPQQPVPVEQPSPYPPTPQQPQQPQFPPEQGPQ